MVNFCHSCIQVLKENVNKNLFISISLGSVLLLFGFVLRRAPTLGFQE